MTPSITEKPAGAQTTAPHEPGTPKKTHTAAGRATRTPAKAKSAKAKKGATTRPKAAGARQGSKTAKVLSLLKRSGGATLKDLMKATGWQAHSVRGFLFGTLKKKQGRTLTSTQGENRERRYSVKA